MEKKFLNIDGLTEYDALIKGYVKSKVFIGTYAEYETANNNGQIPDDALVIITDDETASGGTNGGTIISTSDTYDYVFGFVDGVAGLRKYNNDGTFGDVIDTSYIQTISGGWVASDYGILMNWFRTTVLGLGTNYIAMGYREGKISARGKFLNEFNEDNGGGHVLFAILTMWINGTLGSNIDGYDIDSMVVECIGAEESEAECTMIIDLYTKTAQHYRLQICAKNTSDFVTNGWKRVDYNTDELSQGLDMAMGICNDHEERITTLESSGGSSGGTSGGSWRQVGSTTCWGTSGNTLTTTESLLNKMVFFVFINEGKGYSIGSQTFYGNQGFGLSCIATLFDDMLGSFLNIVATLSENGNNNYEITFYSSDNQSLDELTVDWGLGIQVYVMDVA